MAYFNDSTNIELSVMIGFAVIAGMPYASAIALSEKSVLVLMRKSITQTGLMGVLFMTLYWLIVIAVSLMTVYGLMTGVGWLLLNFPLSTLLAIFIVLTPIMCAAMWQAVRHDIPMLCVVIWQAIRHRLWPNIRDRWQLHLMGPALPVNRKQIADNLSQFLSSRGRTRYIQWLSSRISDLDRNLRNPDDRWPGDTRPNYDNDEASAMLARLDERWLSLSR